MKDRLIQWFYRDGWFIVYLGVVALVASLYYIFLEGFMG